MPMCATVGGYMLMCATMDGKLMNSEIGCEIGVTIGRTLPTPLHKNLFL